MKLPWRNRWAGVFEAFALVGVIVGLIVFLAIGAGLRAIR